RPRLLRVIQDERDEVPLLVGAGRLRRGGRGLAGLARAHRREHGRAGEEGEQDHDPNRGPHEEGGEREGRAEAAPPASPFTAAIDDVWALVSLVPSHEQEGSKCPTRASSVEVSMKRLRCFRNASNAAVGCCYDRLRKNCEGLGGSF